jgi:hypothetical protein
MRGVEAAKIGDNFLCQAFAKGSLPSVAGKVGEWQHSHHGPSGIGWRFCGPKP